MRFIHISDIHLYPPNEGRHSRLIREQLISYIRSKDYTADELLITGDFRHAKYQKKVSQIEINEVVAYVKAIAEAAGITEVEHIHIVPGNHDLDRTIIDGRKLAWIRRKYDAANGRFSKDELTLLKSQFKYFNSVCNTLYGNNHYWKTRELHTYRVLGDTVFLYLNTALTHHGDKDRGRLVIGNDCLDRLLREIAKKYPDKPIIVLAHHSPDCFEAHEKRAVEEILQRNPQVILYLCGDAHEAWNRRVNTHIEIMMGCLRQERTVEETFLYGDTDTNDYQVHHWVREWEPYAAADRRLREYFPAVSDSGLDNQPSLQPSITIPIEEEGHVFIDTRLNNDVLQWVAAGKPKEITVTLEVEKIRKCSERVAQLQAQIDKGVHLSKGEENEYTFCRKEIDRLTEWAAYKKTACECFLNDGLTQLSCQIIHKDDFLDMLSRIINYDPGGSEYHDRLNSPEYETLDFTVTRDDGKGEYYFKAAVKKQMLWDMGLKPDTLMIDLFFMGFKNFTVEARRDIAVYYYIDFGREIFWGDSTIATDKHATNLYEYRVGLH